MSHPTSRSRIIVERSAKVQVVQGTEGRIPGTWLRLSALVRAVTKRVDPGGVCIQRTNRSTTQREEKEREGKLVRGSKRRSPKISRDQREQQKLIKVIGYKVEERSGESGESVLLSQRKCAVSPEDRPTCVNMEEGG